MADEITLDAPETRLERFLAAAAGVEGITLDEPETRIERYLYKIAQGSGGVPTVEDADKGKYLHANESTGALEWAEGGSVGGVLVVTETVSGGTHTLNKTWQEIHDATAAKIPCFVITDNYSMLTMLLVSAVFVDSNSYYVAVGAEGAADYQEFSADSVSGYPSYTE